MQTFKISVLWLSLIIVGAMTTFYLPRILYASPDKFTIAMGGRSIMDQWFRFWNIPVILNKISVYKPWPIPYKKYVRDGIYLEYVPIAAPHKNVKQGLTYGQEMYDSLVKQVSGKKFDAVFFKFCFVDFDDRSITSDKAVETRLAQMTALIEMVYVYTQEQNIKLLLGNALPSLKPEVYAQQLRIQFNQWIKEYTNSHHDITIIDMYGILTDATGALKPDLALDATDSHLNEKAYRLLDQELFSKIKMLFIEAPR